jgi:hypothetical protein
MLKSEIDLITLMQGRIQGGGAHPARAPPKIGNFLKKLA